MGEEVVGDGVGAGAVRHRWILEGIDMNFINIFVVFFADVIFIESLEDTKVTAYFSFFLSYLRHI